MPGIIQNAQAQPTSQVPGQGPASPPGGGQESGEISDQAASPQEQEGKDQIVAAAAKMLYDEKVTQKVVDNLKASEEDPSQAIALIAEGFILKIDEQSKGKMPVELILPAADEILELVGEVGEKSGLFTYDEAMHAKSAQKIIESIAPKFGGTPEEIQAFMDETDPGEAEQMRAKHESMVGGQQAV